MTVDISIDFVIISLLRDLIPKYFYGRRDMCEMKEKEKEVVVLDKGIEDFFAINQGCCPTPNSMKA